MTRSAGQTGLIFSGSPPSFITASRMAAKSTTAGTPLQGQFRDTACQNESNKHHHLDLIDRELMDRGNQGNLNQHLSHLSLTINETLSFERHPSKRFFCP